MKQRSKVRDLNGIGPNKSTGRPYSEPPVTIECKRHKYTEDRMTGVLTCSECGDVNDPWQARRGR